MSHTKNCSTGGVYILALVLVVIGALNWGLVGIGIFAGTNLNVVNLILGNVGDPAWLEAIVYLLVAVSGIYLAFAGCGHCKKKCCDDGSCGNHDEASSSDDYSTNRNPASMPDADGE